MEYKRNKFFEKLCICLFQIQSIAPIIKDKKGTKLTFMSTRMQREIIFIQLEIKYKVDINYACYLVFSLLIH